MVYDPSYGAGPFSDIGVWATNSLAGFAYITFTLHRDAAGNAFVTYKLYGHRGVR